MLTIRKPLLLLSGLILVHDLSWAQGVLRDPTMPPPGFMPAPSADSAGVGDAAVAPQSFIRITPIGGRKQAMVDGRALQTGEQVKQWRLVTITANGVVFKDSRGVRSVPASSSVVIKKPVTGPASSK